MVWFVLMLIGLGLVTGFVARWILPGPDPIGPGRTLVIGLLGSLVGGSIGFLLWGGDTDQVDAWVAAVLGALSGSVGLLLLDNFFTGRKNQLTL